MNDFSLLIKPTAADCNLRCSYCFYIGRQNLTELRPRMSDEVLERVIARYMSSRQAESYTFSWQGGEPTLMGVDFFRKVVEFQMKHGPPGALVCNGLQTNATLITDELAAFLVHYRFLFGVSLDGPAQLHDYYRKSRGGASTHALVLKGIDRLRKHGAEFNILTVVNDRTVKQPREIYGFFRNRGLHHQQYVPCVEFGAEGQLCSYSVTGYAWGEFLCEIFDRWVAEGDQRVSIRLFDSILAYLTTGKRNACTMRTDCRQYFVVEHDGSVYPCDFFVRADAKLGNILNGNWRALLDSSLYRQFGLEKANFCEECRSCQWLEFCQGDCQKFRRSAGADKGKSVLCEGWKLFFAHALPRLRELARDIETHSPPRRGAHELT